MKYLSDNDIRFENTEVVCMLAGSEEAGLRGSKAYFDAHPRLFLLTPNGDYAINVAAGFVTPADAALYNAFNPSAEERKSLVESWMRVSRFVSGIVPTAEDRLVTLSTCSYEYNDARYVVVGVLEELGVRQK